MKARVGIAMHGLDPSRIVDVGNRGNIRARYFQLVEPGERLVVTVQLMTMGASDIGNNEHVGTGTIELEPFACVLGENRGSERPETLPIFNLQVEQALHRGRARIGENRPITEGAWPELHPSLEPANRSAIRQRLGSGVEQRRLVIDNIEACALCDEPLPDVSLRESRAEKRSGH